MKRTFFALAVLCLSTLAFAQDTGKHDHSHDKSDMERTVDPFGNDVWIAIDPPLPPNEEEFRERYIDENEMFPEEELTEAATVSVYAVADEEYRAAYSNWTSKLNNIIETADNAYYRDFRINWVIQGYYNWTSNGSSSSALLADLASDGAGLPNGLCMGFTRDSNFTAGGIAYVYSSNPGTGYSICKDQGDSSTIYALRHEAGHNYGCGHDPTASSPVCMMNYQYAYSVDYFDSAHANTVRNHDHWFN